MNNKLIAIFALLLCVPVFSAGASELGELFGAYEAAAKEGNKGEVVKAAEAVYQYSEANFPAGSKNRAAATLNFGKALRKAGQHKKAEKYLSRAVEGYRKAYGEEVEEVIDPLFELARERAGNVGHSARYRYRGYIGEALDIAEKTQGSESVLYATLLLEAGRIAMDEAKDRKAVDYLEDANEAFTRLGREETLDGFMATFYLGKYHLALKRYSRAEPYLVAALEMSEREDGPNSRLELMTRAFLVEVYEEMGEEEKSIAQCRAIGRATPFKMDQEPEPLFSRALEYPRSALDIRREGYAVAQFTISDSGFAEDIEILQTDGSKTFGTAAVKFLKEARYAPRFVDGEAVDTPNREMKFSFHLAD